MVLIFVAEIYRQARVLLGGLASRGSLLGIRRTHRGYTLQFAAPRYVYASLHSGTLVFTRPSVRHLENTTEAPLLKTKPPFAIEGARNVFLETVKRGLDDDFSSHESPSVVLRLYEAFGGHGAIKLKFAPHLSVVKVLVTNLLEDEVEELSVYQAEDQSSVVKLNFHAFEVKTVKLILGKPR